MSGRGNQLTKQVGEFLVAAELARHGWLAAVLSGNTPDYDLVATDGRGRSVPVQVKAIRTGTWQFDAAKYVEIEFDGKKQIPGRLKRLSVNPVCVLVVVGERGEPDQFYVLPMRTLQRQLVANHRAWLKKHGGVRPKNPKSTHAALSVEQVEQYRDNWGEIKSAAR
jgi:hypothetical protein